MLIVKIYLIQSRQIKVVPMIPLLTALLSTAAYKVQAWNQFTFVGRHRKVSVRSKSPPGSNVELISPSGCLQVILALAAALTFANAPFTALAIIPRVNKLKAIEQSIIKGKVAYMHAHMDVSLHVPAESRD